MLIGQKLATTVSANATRTAFRYLAKSTSFKDFYTYINRESYFFQNEIGHKKRVGVLMTNCPHFFYTFFGIANTLNVMVPFDPALPDPVIADRMKFLHIDILIVSDDMVARARTLTKENSLMTKIIEIEKRRFGEYDTTYRLPVGQSANESDVVAILPTTGHAGKVRFVPFTHKMFEAAALALRSAYRLSGVDAVYSYQATYANPFYFFHGGIIPLICGAGLVIWDNPSLIELAPELVEARASRFIMKASLVREFLNNLAGANLKLPHLRSITLSRGNVEPDTREMADRDFHAKILRVYGSTESCWTVAMTGFEEPEPAAFCGSILPGIKARVVDYNGDDVSERQGQIGQLVVSGGVVFPGYIEDPEATKLTVRGASYYTGDWVEVTKQNQLRLIDRRDNIIRVGPHIITPEAVEKALSAITEVESATALELKDGLGKNRCVAVIQRKPKVALATSEVLKHLEAVLPKGEAPDRVAYVEEMPRDESGINKYKLRRDLAGLV